jgi:hypothetical protein
MRKRYITPGRSVPGKKVWKWIPRDEAVLKEFDRLWKSGRGFILRRRGRPTG